MAKNSRFFNRVWNSLVTVQSLLGVAITMPISTAPLGILSTNENTEMVIFMFQDHPLGFNNRFIQGFRRWNIYNLSDRQYILNIKVCGDFQGEKVILIVIFCWKDGLLWQENGRWRPRQRHWNERDLKMG